ncbi:MAG: DUF2523 family protein [Sedimenticola sp.]
MPLPLIGTSIVAAFAAATPVLIGRVLAALGIGFVVYQGFGHWVDDVTSSVNAISSGQGVPAEIWNWFRYMGGPAILSMWMAGVAAAAAMFASRPLLKLTGTV